MKPSQRGRTSDLPRINDGLEIDDREITLSFLRSAGAGGQNVNKVETAVQLRWPMVASASIDNRVKVRLRVLAGRRLTKDGVLVLTAQRFRTQERNRADVMERFIDLVREAAQPPPTLRRPSRPTRASKERRLVAKKTRATVKAGRGGRGQEPED